MPFQAEENRRGTAHILPNYQLLIPIRELPAMCMQIFTIFVLRKTGKYKH